MGAQGRTTLPADATGYTCPGWPFKSAIGIPRKSMLSLDLVE